MYGALLGQSLLADVVQFAHRCRVGHANLCSHIADAVYAAIPHDIVDADIVAYEGLNIVVNVDNADKSLTLLTKII